MPVRFPDISQYQRGINVAALPGPIVIARCWRGNVNAADTEWPRIRDAARAAGKLPVAYIYVGESSTAIHQAEMLSRTIGDKSIPVMVDWEAGGGNIAHLRNTVHAIQQRGMRVALSYIPRWFWQQQGSPSLAGLPPLVNSHYHNPDNPAAWAPFGAAPVEILQYTDREHHSGMNIDMNVYRGTEAQLMAMLGAQTGRPTLRLGDSGPAVRELQTLLNAAEIPDPKPPVSGTKPARARHLSWVTGERSTSRTDLNHAVGGTDIGVAWDNGDGAVLLAFGGTFNPRQPQGGGGGGDWRSNVLALSTDREPALGGLVIDSFLSDRTGHARQIVPSKKNHEEITTIPTGGISVGLRNYLTYMSVRHWGEPGRWTTNHGGIFYSDDRGKTWHNGPTWPNTGTTAPWFQMTTLVRHGGYLYLFGTPQGRAGNAHLARVPEEKVMDLSAHEVLSQGEWISRLVAPLPDVVFGDRVSELSVAYHEASKQWLAAYFREPEALVVRTAQALEGPWSREHVAATQDDFPGMYGAYFHPWTMTRANPCFLMSLWDPYNVALMELEMEA